MDERFFYQQAQLSVFITDETSNRLMRNDSMLFAYYQGVQATLSACDGAHSVLLGASSGARNSFRYSPYGYEVIKHAQSLSAWFHGERLDARVSCYCLGQGYRFYSPMLMRFLSPDALSPFEKGGTNAYAFCGGDPVNFHDPTGKFPVLSGLRPLFRWVQRSTTRLFKSEPKPRPADAGSPGNYPIVLGVRHKAAETGGLQRVGSNFPVINHRVGGNEPLTLHRLPNRCVNRRFVATVENVHVMVDSNAPVVEVQREVDKANSLFRQMHPKSSLMLTLTGIVRGE